MRTGVRARRASVSRARSSCGTFEFTGLTDPAYRLEVTAADAYAFPLVQQSGVLKSGEEIVLALDPARWPSIR